MACLTTCVKGNHSVPWDQTISVNGQWWCADCVRAELERLRADNDSMSKLLDTVSDAYECGEWNTLLNMKQLHLTRAWYEAVLAAQGGEANE